MFIFAGLNAVHLIAATTMMHEPRTPSDLRAVRRAADSARQAPAVVRAGFGLLRTNRVLRGLLLVEVTAGIAVTAQALEPVTLELGAA